MANDRGSISSSSSSSSSSRSSNGTAVLAVDAAVVLQNFYVILRTQNKFICINLVVVV